MRWPDLAAEFHILRLVRFRPAGGTYLEQMFYAFRRLLRRQAGASGQGFFNERPVLGDELDGAAALRADDRVGVDP